MPASSVVPVETSWTTAAHPPKLAVRLPVVRWLVARAKIIRDTLIVAGNCWYDFLRVIRYTSAVTTGSNREKLAALITINYHGIEKGLSLPQPRPGFGAAQISILISRLERYGQAFGFDENAVIAFNTLREYSRFNEQHGKADPALEARIEQLSRYLPVANDAHAQESIGGGIKLIRRDEFLASAQHDLRDFFNSRCSARQYAEAAVDLSDIERAVEMARKSPSCCNRQSARLWVINEPERVRKALEIQGGARGFGHEAPMALVITSDQACFQSAGERYQHWIDGGMFAMSLIYALHSLGLVSCCLNWSKVRAKDLEFRRAFGLPESHAIIVVLTVGHPKEEFSVAQSPRRPVEELMKVL